MWLDIACALQQGTHDEKAHDLAAGEHQDGTLVVLSEGASADWASWLAARLSVRAFFDALGVPAEKCHFDGFAERVPKTWSVYGIQRDAAAAEHAFGTLWAEWQRTPAEPGASLVEICGRIGRVIERIPELELKLMPQWASFTGLSLRGDRLEIVQCGSNSVWRYDPEDETLRVLSPSDTIREILRYSEQPGADPSGWLADFAPGGTTLEKLREMEPQLLDIGWRALGLKGGARLWTAQVKPGDVLLLTTKRVFDVQGAEQISPILHFAVPERADVQSVAEDIVMGAVREDERYSYGAIIAVVRAEGAPRRKRRPRPVDPATRTGTHDGEAVRAAQLIRRPLDYDRRRITTEGWLTYGFEHANFAGAEIEPPRDFLQRCENLPDRYVGYAGFVRVTGEWDAPDPATGQSPRGNYGLKRAHFVVDCLDEIPPSPRAALSAGELGRRLGEFEGEVVEVATPIVIGHALCRSDDFIDLIDFRFGLLPKAGKDPVEQSARLLLWIEDKRPSVIRCEWLGEARPYPVPKVSASELPAYAGRIVDVEGTLTLGRYWPQLGPCAFLPPELTTLERGLSSPGETIPMHREVVRWRERIEASGGVIQVRARGTVLKEGKDFSAYRVSMGARSVLEQLRSTFSGK